MVTAKLEYIDDKKYKITLSSDKSTKPIAGHRFVDLLGKNHYITRTDLLLDLYGIKFVPQNDYMKLGQLLEEPVIKYKFPNNSILRFTYEDYKDCKSGAFNLDEEDIGGLPDGIIPEEETLIEVKCTTSKFKGFKEEWALQAQFYAYWWNKKKAKETGIKIKKCKVLKYYVPKDLMEAHMEFPNWVVGKNLIVQDLELDTTEIRKLIAKARKAKETLIKDSSFEIDITSDDNVFFQIKKAMNTKKLQLDYDKEDMTLRPLLRKIYGTKIKRKKKNKSSKGKVKI